MVIPGEVNEIEVSLARKTSQESSRRLA